MNLFRLEKWYFDSITPLGHVWIGYSAKIHCLGFQLSYAQSLLVYKGKKHLQTSFRKHLSPTHDPSLSCTTSLFEVKAQKSIIADFNQYLFNDDKSFVDWHCIEPSTTLNIKFPNRSQISGTGYIEKLTMTAMPWNLPMNALIWGRFIGKKHCMVWIHWHHNFPQSWLFVNGKKRPIFEINRTEVLGNNIALNIENKGTLIASYPFKEHTRILNSIMPSSMRKMREEKWYAKGNLMIDGEKDYGSIIHEYVVFNHETK